MLSTFLTTTSKSLFAQIQVSPTYSVDGNVYALASKGDSLIIGGDFSYVGKYREGMSMFTTTSDQPDSNFPRIVGDIYLSTPDGNGGFYIYGNFRKITEPNGSNYNRLEHILSNYSFDNNFSLSVDVGYKLWDILFYNNILYISGQLVNKIGGVKVSNLSGYDVINKQFVNWIPATDNTKDIKRLFIWNNTLYIAGLFTYVGTQQRKWIAAIQLNTGIVKSWNPNLNEDVRDILSYKDRLVIGGGFTDGTPFGQHSLALIDTTTGQNLQWEFKSSGLFGNQNQYLYWAAGVTRMAISGNILYAKSSGTFDTRVTAVDLNNNNIDSNKIWAKYFNMTDEAYGMLANNGSVFLVGNFSGTFTTDSVNASQFFEKKLYGSVKLDATTGDLQNWYPDCVGKIGNSSNTISASGNRLFIGGRYSHVNGIEKGDLAMINTKTNTVLPYTLNAQWTSQINCFKIVGNTLYAGGGIDLYTGVGSNTTFNPFVTIDLINGQTTGYLPNAFYTDISAIEVNNNYIFMGGGMTERTGAQRRYLLAMDRSTNTISSWTPLPSNQIYALNITGNILYVGGGFLKMGDSVRNHAAAFNVNNLKLNSWNPNADGHVRAITSSTGTIWLGGDFKKIGTTNVTYFAGVDPFNASLTHKINVNQYTSGCNALAIKGKNVIMGGNMKLYSNTSCNSLYIYDTINKKLIPDSSFCMGIDNDGWGPSIWALSFVKNDLYFGGRFNQVNGGYNTQSLDRVQFPNGFFNAPTISISPDKPIPICEGTPLTFTASTTNASNTSTYQWKKNGTNVGSNSATYVLQTPQSNDTITCTITSFYTNVTSNAIAVTVNPAPAKPVITASGATTNICPNKTITLTSSSSVNNVWSTGAISQSITVKASGSYTVTVSNALGCTNTSDTTKILYQTCSKPSGLAVGNITNSSAKLSWTPDTCAVGYQYEWRKKGAATWIIAQTAGNSKTITGLSSSTTYQWRVIKACRITPDTIVSGYTIGPEFTTLVFETIAANALGNTKSSSFKVIPNPTIGNSTIVISNGDKWTMIKVIDVSGKVIWQIATTEKSVIVPSQKFANGTYVVTVTGSSGTETKKFVKQ